MYTIKDCSLFVTVIIKTNAKQNAIIGVFDDKLKIALNAKPIQGKANKVLIKFLANIFNIPQNSVEIVRGDTNHIKMIKLPLGVQDKLDVICIKSD